MTQSRAAAGGDTADASPQSGIVWIYHFQPDGSAELVPNERVDEALDDHVGWTWVHLSLADTRCRLWIAQNERLSELARETLLGPDEHLRLDVLGHEIVGVVPDLQQEFAQSSDALVRLRFAMTERVLISARRSSRSIRWRSTAAPSKPASASRARCRCSTRWSTILPTPLAAWPSGWPPSSTASRTA